MSSNPRIREILWWKSREQPQQRNELDSIKTKLWRVGQTGMDTFLALFLISRIRHAIFFKIIINYFYLNFKFWGLFFPFYTINSFALRTKPVLHLSDDSRRTALRVRPATRPDRQAKTEKSQRATKPLCALANPEGRRNYHQPRAGHRQRASLKCFFITVHQSHLIKNSSIKPD